MPGGQELALMEGTEGHKRDRQAVMGGGIT